MSKKRPPGRINEEYVCIDSFIRHIREIDNIQEIEYCDEPNETVDFWVTIAGVKYAVEVTSISADDHYDALCYELLESICSECETSNNAKGTYALILSGRPRIPRRITCQRKLISTAATRIQEMSNAPCGVESCLLKDTNGHLAIEKRSDQGNMVGWCISKQEAKWKGVRQEELSHLLKDAIDKKLVKLEKKGVLHRCSNVILLLYDAYAYGDIEDMHQALSNIQGYEWLHSIFLATSFSNMPNELYPDSPGRRGTFLYSKNEHWH